MIGTQYQNGLEITPDGPVSSAWPFSVTPQVCSDKLPEKGVLHYSLRPISPVTRANVPVFVSPPALTLCMFFLTPGKYMTGCGTSPSEIYLPALSLTNGVSRLSPARNVAAEPTLCLACVKSPWHSLLPVTACVANAGEERQVTGSDACSLGLDAAISLIELDQS